MESCLREGRSVGLRHYLYGSTPEVLRDLHATISQQWPGCLVVGAESPAFGDLTDTDRASADVRFRVTEADVVWVGLGTPKQDFVVDRLAQSGAATFVAIGAGFDFLAGTKRRAPSWMQRAGLEWVFRLYSEPRRLWRRYLIGNLQFLVAVARHR